MVSVASLFSFLSGDWIDSCSVMLHLLSILKSGDSSFRFDRSSVFLPATGYSENNSSANFGCPIGFVAIYSDYFRVKVSVTRTPLVKVCVLSIARLVDHFVDGELMFEAVSNVLRAFIISLSLVFAFSWTRSTLRISASRSWARSVISKSINRLTSCCTSDTN